MDIGTFSEKLRQLNPHLYVDVNHRTYSTGSVEGSSGIYLRGQHANKISALGCGATSVRGAEAENSSPDLYVGWTQHGYVPEGDRFDLDSGRVLCQGWRTIVRRLVSAGYVTAPKAEKVMGYVESWYDCMNYDQKLAYHREDAAQWPSPQL